MDHIRRIETDRAFISSNRLSQALLVSPGNMLYLSGQLGINQDTGKLGKDSEEETRQILENIKAILECAGSSLGQVVRSTIFVTQQADTNGVNKVYEEYFPPSVSTGVGPHPPARSLIVVAGLGRGATVEIECTAFVP